MRDCRDCFNRLTHFCPRPYGDDDECCDEYRNVHDERAEDALTVRRGKLLCFNCITTRVSGAAVSRPLDPRRNL
jgi:hypothetical protein